MKNAKAGDAVPTIEPRSNAIQESQNISPVRRRICGMLGPLASTTIHFLPDASEVEDEDVGDDDDDDGSRCLSRLRICANCKLGRALVEDVSLAGDLASHMFGHLVSTELAKDILTTFIKDDFVRVSEAVVLHGELAPGDPIDPHSEDEVRRAVGQAFDVAAAHDYVRLPPQGNAHEEPPPSASQAKADKEKTYFFTWCTFPKEPLKEDELVSFLNEITDRAFAVARSQRPTTQLELKHRLASPKDKDHAVPLAYGLDRRLMRPDFLLLPIEAFSNGGFKTLDEKYINFTALCLVGGLDKDSDPREGFEQIQQYARAFKCAQPWVYYVLGMMISKDMAVFSRGDCSGWEHLALVLWDGCGSIEFIRLLLGLALADGTDLGQNLDVKLKSKIQTCTLNALTLQHVSSNEVSTANSHVDAATSSDDGDASATSRNDIPTAARQKPVAKRRHSEIEKDDDNEEGPRLKKRKTVEIDKSPERLAFSPEVIYGYRCMGIMWTPGSPNGRQTTVFGVEDPEDKEKRLALKLWWEDLIDEVEQIPVTDRLERIGHHPNVIVPLKTLKAERNGKTCTTLGVIRGFLEDQVADFPAENRVLTVSVSELKRPVKYFWGVHDFVRGIRGALLGHAYLTKIGILHRDISENNMVLGLYPWEERGYLIDFDLAILQDAEEPSPLVDGEELIKIKRTRYPLLKRHHETIHGTDPYVSINVLHGKKHTHFDDVESFFYVLLLFFLSYAGPLPKETLREAHARGFIPYIEAEYCLPHKRRLPDAYAAWKNRSAFQMGCSKWFAVCSPQWSFKSAEFVESLTNNWPPELRSPIWCLLRDCVMLFQQSIQNQKTKGGRSEVSHAQFIDVLDMWLEKHGDLEHAFSNCPFEDGK